ncbi:hypothetical protein [Draconibacterium sediminis]|uniref:hypothetical protein n=1 Tax=Draconibacterium sediminis TaxID=1544798 RepID=UPI0026EEEE62|nr:hypothetical protein [Draconibacterium sediminis]
MITEYDHFSDDLDRINKELTSYEKKVWLIRKNSIHDFSKENITLRFNEIFRTFPYHVEPQSQSIGMSIYTRELFDLYNEISSDGIIKNSIIEKVKERFAKPEIREGDEWLIYEYVQDCFHELILWYEKYLKNTKKLHFFYGVKDESIILKNLLKLYKSILSDDSIQLSVFWGIQLTKKIADIITEMLIEFIEARLMVLNPDIETLLGTSSKITLVNNKNKSIEWLGSQQELCELFLELSKKGWIPNVKDGERKLVSDSITNLFDINGTKRKSKSDPKNSFYQQFKGEVIKGERCYVFLESDNYNRKFNEIVKNNK